MDENIKTLDELVIENGTLTEEVNKLRERLSLLDKDGEELKRVNTILSENTQLKDRAEKAEKLIDELTKEREKDKDIMVGLMRNYSMKKNDAGFFGEDGKSDEQKKFEEAKEAVDNWVKEFEEKGIKV